MEACRNKEVENIYQSVYESCMKFEFYAVKCTAIDSYCFFIELMTRLGERTFVNLLFDPARKRINLNLQFFIFES